MILEGKRLSCAQASALQRTMSKWMSSPSRTKVKVGLQGQPGESQGIDHDQPPRCVTHFGPAERPQKITCEPLDPAEDKASVSLENLHPPHVAMHSVQPSPTRVLHNVTSSPTTGRDEEEDEWTCFIGGGEGGGGGGGGVGGGEGRAAKAGHSARAKDLAADPVVGGGTGGAEEEEEDGFTREGGGGGIEGGGGEGDSVIEFEMESGQPQTASGLLKELY